MIVDWIWSCGTEGKERDEEMGCGGEGFPRREGIDEEIGWSMSLYYEKRMPSSYKTACLLLLGPSSKEHKSVILSL